MFLSDISLIGWLHTITCVIAFATGAYILAARKGTKIHRRLGWWYAGAMAVLNLSVLVIYRFDFLPGTQAKPGPVIFGFFHYGALAELAAVALAVFAASRQRRNRAWAHIHAQAMLGSYYGLIGGLINEMFFRVLALRTLAERMSPHAANSSRTMLVALTQDAAMLLWLVLAVVFFRQVSRAHRRHDLGAFTIGYPMRYSGGAFLVCVGACLVLGAFYRGGAWLGLALAGGMLMGALVLVKIRRLIAPFFGGPSEWQTRVMLLAVGLEIAIFMALGASGFFQRMPHLLVWEIALAIVGAHFLIMRWSHGAVMTWLGLSVLAWLGVGIALHLPLPLIAIGDGLLKLGFGLEMAEPLLLRRESLLARSARAGFPSPRIANAMLDRE